jgi:hypothetical protein
VNVVAIAEFGGDQIFTCRAEEFVVSFGGHFDRIRSSPRLRIGMSVNMKKDGEKQESQACGDFRA